MTSYTTAHLRLARFRGPARDRPCTDCAAPADQWSYDHRDPDEVYDTNRSGRVVPFSLDIRRYEPRCRSCHVRFDKSRGTQRPCGVAGCTCAVYGARDFCWSHWVGPRRRQGDVAGKPSDEHGRIRPVRAHDGATRPPKRCSTCREVQPAASFTIDRSKASGLASRCLTCDRAYSRARYAARRVSTY